MDGDLTSSYIDLLTYNDWQQFIQQSHNSKMIGTTHTGTWEQQMVGQNSYRDMVTTNRWPEFTVILQEPVIDHNSNRNLVEASDWPQLIQRSGNSQWLARIQQRSSNNN